MMSGPRIGDGFAMGDDLIAAADSAVADALASIQGSLPDLAFIFVSGGSPDEAAAALAYAATATGARTSTGCNAHGVIGAGQAAEAARGVSVWVASLPSVEVRAFHLEVLRTSESIAVVGMTERRDSDVVGVMIADPWSFPVDGFVGHSHESLRGLPLVGGLASGAGQAGDTRLLVDGHIHDRGAVGVVIGGDVSVHALVSQGCRPIGRPMTVTSAEGSTILKLAGRPALEQAKDAVAMLPTEEQPLAVRGLHLGVAVDEYADDHAHGDFLVRGIAGADQASGSITIGDVVEIGSTVQFLLRDADAAHDDLVSVLGHFRTTAGGGSPAGALLFTCTGRGRAMFPSADHDSTAVRRGLGVDHVAGFFAAGEIGPVGGHNHVHTFTATVLAFGS